MSNIACPIKSMADLHRLKISIEAALLMWEYQDSLPFSRILTMDTDLKYVPF